ncbi:MAPEG family protein [Asticcacaulis solisilvae]|uniref:MAPEG family protein n=1 Tax=Asticcacaulis solisilvae TaxID=1217274 RepID=UPI003FD8E706
MTLPTLEQMLAASVALLIVQIFAQAQAFTKEKGSAWNAGPRDGGNDATGVFAGRVKRALDNYEETWPAFAALALALMVTGHTNGLGAGAALAWLAARLVYIPLYYAGIPYARSLVWLVSVAALVAMIVALV